MMPPSMQASHFHGLERRAKCVILWSNDNESTQNKRSSAGALPEGDYATRMEYPLRSQCCWSQKEENDSPSLATKRMMQSITDVW